MHISALSMCLLCTLWTTVYSCCRGGMGGLNGRVSNGCHNCPAGKIDPRRYFNPSYAGQVNSNLQPGQSIGGYPYCWACPNGWANPNTKQVVCTKCASGIATSDKKGCISCLAGKYVTGSGCTDCPAGQWQNQAARSGCNSCPATYYCPRASTSGTANRCAQGTYGNSQGLGTSICNGLCPEGNYCADGKMYSCPAGKYGAGKGYSNANQCQPCPAGNICPTGTGVKLTACGSTPYYCLTGTSSTSGRKIASTGYYTSGGDDASRRTGQTPCPQGNYCANGKIYQCPIGRYGSTTKLQSSSCSGSCSAGYHCDLGSKNSMASSCAPLNCDSSNPCANWYCPGGSGRRVVTSGYYSTPETDSDRFRTGETKCSIHETCVNGVRKRKVSWTNDFAPCSSGQTSKLLTTVAENQQSWQTTITGSSNVPGQSITFQLDGSSSSCGPGAGIGDTSTSKFRVFSTNKLGLSSPLSYTACPLGNPWRIRIKAIVGSYSTTCILEINVGDVNEQPSVNGGQSFTIPENSAKGVQVSGGPVIAKDPEVAVGAQDITWSITNCDGISLNACPLRVGSCSGVLKVDITSAINFEVKSTYSITIRALDDHPTSAQYGSNTVTVRLLDVNEAPTFSGQAMVVQENVAETFLVGILPATDPDSADAGKLVFTNLNPDVPFYVSTTGEVTVKYINGMGPDYELRNEYSLSVSVKDTGWGGQPILSAGPEQVTVTVKDQNDPPTIIMEGLEDLTSGLVWSSVVMYQAGSEGALNGIWGAEVKSVTTTVPISPGTGNVRIQLRYWAIDSWDGGEAGRLKVDGVEVWSKTRQSYGNCDGGWTNAGSSAGIPDPWNGNGNQICYYDVDVTVNVGGTSTKNSFQLTLTADINSAKTDESWAFNRLKISKQPSIALNELCGPSTDTAACQKQLTYEDQDDTATAFGGKDDGWSISATTKTCGDRFQITSNGLLKPKKILNYEVEDGWTTPVCSLTLRLCDKGAACTEQEVDMIINDINEPPSYDSTTSCSIREDASPSDIVCILKGTDPDIKWNFPSIASPPQSLMYIIPSSASFGVKDSNKLIVLKSLDFEVASTHTFNVQISDNGNPVKQENPEKQQVVTIIDVNEAPVITNHQTARTIDENSAIDSNVGVALAATDPDTNTATAAWKTLTYDLLFDEAQTQDALGKFKIDQNSGQIQVASLLDYELKQSYTLVVRVRDGGSPKLENKQTIFINIDNVNEAPVLVCQNGDDRTASWNLNTAKADISSCPTSQPDEEFFVVKEAVRGTMVGRAIKAKDVDFGLPVFTFSQHNSKWDNNFELVQANGANTAQIKVLSDGQTQVQKYELTVIVKDSDNKAGEEVTFIIQGLEKNNPPTMPSGQTLTIDENSPLEYEISQKVQCSDTDIDQSCTGAQTCQDNFDTAETCNAGNSCSWDTINNHCTCRQQSKYFRVEAISAPGQEADEPEPTVFGISDDDQGTLFVTPSGIGPRLDFEFRKEFIVTVVCIDTGLNDVYATNGQNQNEKLDNGEWPDGRAGSLSHPRRYIGSLSTTTQVTVNVLNVDEAPVFSTITPGFLNMTVPENSNVGTLLTDINTGINEIVANDDDADDFRKDLTFSLSGADAAPFEVVATGAESGLMKVKVAMLNYEEKNMYILDVKVKDDTPTTNLFSTIKLSIHILDVNDEPLLDSDFTSTRFSLKEDAALGFEVGIFGASDQDPEDELSFLILSGNEQATFNTCGIGDWCEDTSNRGRKAKIFRGTGPLDFETKKEYTLEMQVGDGRSPELTDTAFKFIDVVDVDDVRIDTVEVPDETLETKGGSTVIIVGANFGRIGIKPTLKVTYINPEASGTAPMDASCALTDLSKNDKLTCTAGIGFGSGHVWTVVVSGASAGVDTSVGKGTTSYTFPKIESISNGGVLNTAGGDIVTLVGTNFGPSGTKYVGKYGGEDGYCNILCSVAEAHTNVQCTTITGIGRVHGWSIVEPKHDWGTESVSTATTSYALPIIRSIVVKTDDGLLTTHGGDTVVLIGENFGAGAGLPSTCTGGGDKVISGGGDGTSTAAVVLGSSIVAYWGPAKRYVDSATCRVTKPHTEITCTSVAGIGKNHQWVVDVQGQVSAISTATTSYQPPVLYSMSGPGAFNAATDGGEMIYLNGDYFGVQGQAPDPIVLNYGRQNFHTFTTTCTVMITQTVLSCPTIPGAGFNFSYVVTVDGQSSSTDNEMGNFLGSYSPPVLFAISPVADLRTPGREIISIIGTNFGPPAAWNQIVADYGDDMTSGLSDATRFPAFGCNVTVAHTKIECWTTEGAGSAHAWLVTVSDQVNRMPSTSYGAPQIHSIESLPAGGMRTDGGDVVLIKGANFGPTSIGSSTGSFLESVTYGADGTGYKAKDCSVLAHDTVRCTTVAGTGANLFWQVTTKGQKSALGITSSYQEPIIVPEPCRFIKGQLSNARDRCICGHSWCETEAPNSGNLFCMAKWSACSADKFVEAEWVECDGTNGPKCYNGEHAQNPIDMTWKETGKLNLGEPTWNCKVEGGLFPMNTNPSQQGDGTDDTNGDASWFQGNADTNWNPLTERLTIKTKNGGLQDSSAKQTIIFNNKYQITPDLLLNENRNGYDYFSFILPELVNNMNAKDIPIQLRVKSGKGGDTSSLQHSRAILWSYTPPFITKIIVREGKTSQHREISVQGTNFGAMGSLSLFQFNKTDGRVEYVLDSNGNKKILTTLNAPWNHFSVTKPKVGEDDGVDLRWNSANVNTTYDITGVQQNNDYYIMEWSHEKIVFQYYGVDGMNDGIVQVSRGNQFHSKSWNAITPEILEMYLVEDETDYSDVMKPTCGEPPLTQCAEPSQDSSKLIPTTGYQAGKMGKYLGLLRLRASFAGQAEQLKIEFKLPNGNNRECKRVSFKEAGESTGFPRVDTKAEQYFAQQGMNIPDANFPKYEVLSDKTTLIWCRAPPGFDKNVGMVMYKDGQLPGTKVDESEVFVIRYAPPTVTAATPIFLENNGRSGPPNRKFTTNDEKEQCEGSSVVKILGASGNEVLQTSTRLCAQTDGTTTVTLVGENFGENGNSVCVFGPNDFGNMIEIPTQHDAHHTTITCTIPQGVGSRARYVYVRTHSQTSMEEVMLDNVVSLHYTVSYLKPHVYGVVPVGGTPTGGNFDVNIYGDNFDVRPSSSAFNTTSIHIGDRVTTCVNPKTEIIVGSTECKVGTQCHRTTCTVLHGVGKALELRMDIGSGRCSSFNDEDNCVSTCVWDGVYNRCTSLDNQFYAPALDAANNPFAASTQMTFDAPAIQSVEVILRPRPVLDDPRKDTLDDLNRDAPPLRDENGTLVVMATEVPWKDPLSLSTYGNDTVILRGTSFGLDLSFGGAENQALIKLGTDIIVPYNYIILRNHTTIIFNTPEGHGKMLQNLKVRMTVSQQMSADINTIQLSYRSPTIRTIFFPASNMKNNDFNIPGIYEHERIPTSGCAEFAKGLASKGSGTGFGGKRVCQSRATVQIFGNDFAMSPPPTLVFEDGSGKITKIVPFGEINQELEKTKKDSDESTPYLLAYDHFGITAVLPSGMGKTKITLTVAGKSVSETFWYTAPKILSTKWSPDLATGGPQAQFDAVGSLPGEVDDALASVDVKYTSIGGTSESILFFFGTNLGDSPPPSGTFNINISGIPCDEPKWNPHSKESSPPGSPYITCRPRPTRVGEKQIDVNVALRDVSFSSLPDGTPIEARCSENYYGKRGEYCVQCWYHYDDYDNMKYATNCTGRWDAEKASTAEPVAVAGFSLLPPAGCSGEDGELCEDPTGMMSNPGQERVPESCMAYVSDEFGTMHVSEECANAAQQPGEFCDSLRLNGTFEDQEVSAISNKQYTKKFDETTNAWINDETGTSLTYISTRSVCPYIMPCEPKEACLQESWSTTGFHVPGSSPIMFNATSNPMDVSNSTSKRRLLQTTELSADAEEEVELNATKIDGFSSCAFGYVSYYRSWLGKDPKVEKNPSPEDDLPCPRGSIKLLGRARGAYSGLPGECDDRRFCKDFFGDKDLVAPEYIAGRCYAPRCGECNPSSHFRLEGVCEPCPKQPWLIPLVMCGIAIFGGLAMYILTKKAVSLAIISIGIDYFQVLSTFRKSKVAWPEEIKWLLRQMQWFNFDIDMTGPECAFRSFMTFTNKWWIKVSMPFIGALLMFSVIGIGKVHNCLCSKKSKKKKKQEVPTYTAMLSMVVTVIYFMYLVITRAAMDIFNCQETVPPTGAYYMASLPQEKCHIKDGIQQSLILPATIVLIFYCIGFPGLVFFIFWRKKSVIQKDQILRAAGRGNSYTENDNYEFRRSCSKLYYQYKPKYYYWIEMIITRKFCMVTIGIIFRNNPTFQMSACLLLLFFSLVATVHTQPFLGFRERGNLIQTSYARKIAKMEAEFRMAENLHSMAHDEEGFGMYDQRELELKAMRRRIQETRKLQKKNVRALHINDRWYFNYNVVEEFFLVCGVLVNLCGVMFDSSYMKNPKNTKSKRFLTYSCIVIIVISIVYFIIVFIYEICTAYRNQKARTKMHWNKLSTRSFKGISGGGKRGLVSASSQQKKKNAKVPDHDYDEVLEHLAGHATGTGAAGGSLHPAFQKLAKMQDIPDEDDDHFDDMALGRYVIPCFALFVYLFSFYIPYTIGIFVGTCDCVADNIIFLLSLPSLFVVCDFLGI